LEFVTQIFDFLCSQYHQCIVGGVSLPFCQRCTGLYVGAAMAGGAVLLCRPRPTALYLWAHGLMLLQMVPFGYHLLPQVGFLRMLTGQMFGIGLIGYLVLLPASYVAVRRPTDRTSSWKYALCGLVSVAVLQLAVRLPSPLVADVLTWIGLAGLLMLTGLILVNLVLLPIEIFRLARRLRNSKTP
jgi:hypothetical protein